MAAREALASDVSARLGRYLASDDLRVSVNVFLSLLSVPAPPIFALEGEDEDVAGGGAASGSSSSAGGQQRSRVDPVILDVAGVGSDHLPHPAAGGLQQQRRPGMRKILSLVLSSAHALQPSQTPGPSAAVVPVVAERGAAMGRMVAAGGASGVDAVEVGPRAAASASGGLQPQPLEEQRQPQQPQQQQPQQQHVGVPPVSSPVLVIELKLSLLTLFADVAAARAAATYVAQLDAAVAATTGSLR
jgi:hypothetical protein